jgi:hypothetical protein
MYLPILNTTTTLRTAVLRALALLALVVACNEQPELLNEIPRVPDTDRTRLTAAQLPPRPSYPRPRSGKLVTISAGDYDIHGSWSTHAGICDQQGVLEIYAGPQGLGTALMLRMQSEDRLGEYPVVPAAAQFPSAPVALIAVQIFDEPDGLGFQAYDGTLELTELGDEASGRFTSTLREINLDILTHYVGVFENLPVRPLAAEYCQVLQDSTLASDSTSDAG